MAPAPSLSLSLSLSSGVPPLPLFSHRTHPLIGLSPSSSLFQRRCQPPSNLHPLSPCSDAGKRSPSLVSLSAPASPLHQPLSIFLPPTSASPHLPPSFGSASSLSLFRCRRRPRPVSLPPSDLHPLSPCSNADVDETDSPSPSLPRICTLSLPVPMPASSLPPLSLFPHRPRLHISSLHLPPSDANLSLLLVSLPPTPVSPRLPPSVLHPLSPVPTPTSASPRLPPSLRSAPSLPILTLTSTRLTPHLPPSLGSAPSLSLFRR